MLLTNFYAIMASVYCGIESYGIVPKANVKALNGTIYTSPSYGYNSKFAIIPGDLNTNSRVSTCLVFGSDNTPVTVEDYKINNRISVGGSVGRYSCSYNEDTKTFEIKRRYVINNTSSSAITIREFGVENTMVITGGSYIKFLIYREVLDEEVVLEAGDTINFDLTVKYSVPQDYVPYTI